MKHWRTAATWLTGVAVVCGVSSGGSLSPGGERGAYSDLGQESPTPDWASAASLLGEGGSERGLPDGRSVTCDDPNAIDENEPTPCGSPNDFFNGGCSSQFASFFPIICGDVVCGTSGYDGVVRDADWFEFTYTPLPGEPLEIEVEFEVEAGFDAVIGAVDTGGVAGCGGVTGLLPFANVDAGETGRVRLCVTPGTYYFAVLPRFGQIPFGCGAAYVARLSCGGACPEGACCLVSQSSCVQTQGIDDCAALGGAYQGDGTSCGSANCQPPANDDWQNAIPYTAGTQIEVDLRNATLQTVDEVPPCLALGSNPSSVWYRISGSSDLIRYFTCGSELNDVNATDSALAIYLIGADQTPVFSNILICNDDACGPTGLLSSLCFSGVSGSEYYLQVLAWDDASRGRYLLTSENCPEDDPGACCIPLFEDCFLTDTEQACVDFGGKFYGEGTSCAEPSILAECDAAVTPPNTSCGSSTLLTPGQLKLESLEFAFEVGGSTPDCGLPIDGRGLWYRVIGTGETMTASLCTAILSFDARMHVYCGSCGSLTCVGANDDSFGELCPLAPEVSWRSEIGTVYWILVSSGDGQAGPYEIVVTGDGAAASDPAECGSCSISCSPGAVPEGEPNCQTGYLDTTNPGCGASPAVYGVIEPGQTVCGTSGTFDNGPTSRGRDVDWFAFELTAQSDVTWTVRAEFLVETLLLNDACGDDLAAFDEGLGNACQPVTLTARLEPGRYTLLVEPQFFDDVSCGARWEGTLTATPTANNGACCLSDGSCLETTFAGCADRIGAYSGVGTSCSAADCTPPAGCPGDVTGDGQVDVSDFFALAQNFGTPSGATREEGDLTGDGAVDISDFFELASNFGGACP